MSLDSGEKDLYLLGRMASPSWEVYTILAIPLLRSPDIFRVAGCAAEDSGIVGFEALAKQL
jgi:hypothetical protein